MAKRLTDTLREEKADAELKMNWAWEHTASAYLERDLLVCALARCYPSHRMIHTQLGRSKNPRNVVCIHTPVGQLNFVLNDDMEAMLSDLPLSEDNHYDGIKRPEKRARMEQLGRQRE